MGNWLLEIMNWFTVEGNQQILWTVLSWLMSAIAFAGTVMNAERNKWGFVFWLISNLYMSVRFFVIKEYAQSILFFLYFILAIRGIFSWTKKEEREEAIEEQLAKSQKEA